jgi:amino acid adenylation domain-containing protein
MRTNLIEYLELTVIKQKNKTAVIDGDRDISFSELVKRSRIIASAIIGKRDCLNRPIAVYLSKSIEAVYADIAITYSGNIYMNLDYKTPQERIKNILALIQPEFIITNTKLLHNIVPIVPVTTSIINIDDISGTVSLPRNVMIDRLSGLIDTDPYCIINTSGSTGTPKGVVLNHKSFFDFLDWSFETFELGETEIIGSLSPLVFDIYSFELCMLMAKGSTIVLIPDALAAFPVKILDLIQKHNTNFIFWVPTIMVNIANMDLLSKVSLHSLDMVWFAGEVFPTKQFKYWKKYLPKTKFVNLYGPIEITLDCTYYIVDRELKDEEPIPIGFPCRNTDILILDSNNKSAKIHQEGELCVRGSSLALGYYNNPEKTAAVFVQNPLNNSYPELIYRTGDLVHRNEKGEIIFKGRKDSLIKHMGYRIELGEIEHVINNVLKLVENCCAVYNFNKKEITLFFETKKEISISTMPQAIGKVLPKYMIPKVFVKMDQMPRNINGKIDRLKLTHQVNQP